MIRVISYAYDVNGIRTSKVRNGIEYKYIYDGNNLIAEQHIQGGNSEWIYYLYGVDGVAGFRYNDTTYLYRKNVQGDVTHIYTESGEQVAHYAYDAWGNVQILQDRNEIATINPFRYRSYYFDEESKFYYLQTRYYDPALGRFISADSIEYLDPETLGGLNLYAYCGNNPVMRTDSLGTDWNSFWKGVGDWFVKAGNWINDNIIQPTATFFRENWDVVAGVFLFALGVAIAIGAFGIGTCIAGVVCGTIIGGLVGGLNAYATGGDIGQGIFTGMLIGCLGGISPAAAGFAAAGMSFLNDRMNGKKAGWDTVGRAALAGLSATAFAQAGNLFSGSIISASGFTLLNGAVFVERVIVGTVSLCSAFLFTFANWAFDLTIGAFNKR